MIFKFLFIVYVFVFFDKGVLKVFFRFSFVLGFLFWNSFYFRRVLEKCSVYLFLIFMLCVG